MSHWRVQQLTCDCLSGVRTTQTNLATARARDTSTLEHSEAGSWSIGIGEQARSKVSC